MKLKPRCASCGPVLLTTGQGKKGDCSNRSLLLTWAVITQLHWPMALLRWECALKALNVGPGDEVITTSRTFIASASCAALLGARPVFADVNRESQNITAESIRAVLTPRTKAIVVVHLAGWPCEMDGILTLARERGITVVEDCAQSHGASYKGSLSARWEMWRLSTSWPRSKQTISTAGEGGMVTTNSAELWDAMWSLKDHGKKYDTVYNREHPFGFRWLHESFGTNWRMTEFQAAIGRLQLRKLSRWVEIRRYNAEMLSQCFSELPGLRVARPQEHIVHSYYKYYAFVRPETLRSGWSRDRILEEVTARGVFCFSGSCSEVYLEKAFPAEWRPEGRLPVARELGETSLMFPVHPTLSHEEIAGDARLCGT